MNRRTVVALAGIVALMGVSGCTNPPGEDGDQKAGSASAVAAVKKDATIAAMLPQSIRDKGEFTASINADVEPIKFVDSSGKISGLNPDLLRAAAKVLGIKVDLQTGSFDAMVPGLEAKRFDAIASAADFVERQTKIDFIDYLKNGTAIIAGTKFDKKQVSRDDLCGLSIGYGRGTSQQGSLEAIAAKCKADGKPALSINGYNDPGAGILSLKSGEADAFWGDLPQMSYNVKKNPDLFKIIYKEQVSILGIGINKDNPEFRDALRAALLKLVDDGTYDALLKKWGLQDFGIPGMQINSDIKMAG